jgi:plastocyanin
MTPPASRHSPIAVLVLYGHAAFAAHAAFAGTVTVNVKTSAGAAVHDAIVVFDPLDAVPEPSHDTATIDQINKRYVPRVSVIRTGTAVTLPNSDHIRHQVYSFSPAKTFSLKLYAGSPRVAVTFDKPGLVVLGCNIHDTMVAFVGIVDTPYFAKSGDSGSLTLPLPTGRYRLRVWHPNLASAPPSQVIEVGAAPLVLPISLELDPDRETVPAWPE